MTLSADDRVVVTGAAGFIGSHLTTTLLQLGVLVDAIDDMSGGDTAGLPLGRRGLTVHRLRLGDPRASESIAELVHGASLVMHLASPIGVGLAHRSASATESSILSAGAFVVESCREAGTPLLFTSSSEAYGSQPVQRLHEDLRPNFCAAPRWSYGRAKLAVEQMIRASVAEGLRAWCVRLFNVVGARQRPDTGLVVPSFCDAALSGLPLKVHDGGRAVRAFAHVDDIVTGLIDVAGCDELVGQSVNLGGTTELSVAELAELVVDLVGPAPIVSTPSAEVFGEGFAPVVARLPDLSRARAAIGWDPRRSVEEAIFDCAASIPRADTALAS